MQLLATLLLPCALAQPVIQFDAWGSDSIRVRVAPAGAAIVDPPFSPLLLPHPAPPLRASSRERLASGNLLLAADGAGFTATRVSDGVVLFTTKSLSFGPAANGSRAGAVSAAVTLALPPGNRLYGLGEHRTGLLDATGYAKRLEDSQYYSQSHGADIMIPYYAASPLNVGLLWCLPSFGNVSLAADGTHTWTSVATSNIDIWITTTPAAPPAPTADPAAASPLALMLRNYVDAVGHAAPMPSYVAGFWACKNRYRSAAQVLSVVQEYRARQLPLSIITIDCACSRWRRTGLRCAPRDLRQLFTAFYSFILLSSPHFVYPPCFARHALGKFWGLVLQPAVLARRAGAGDAAQ